MVDLDWEAARAEKDNPTTPLGRLVNVGSQLVCGLYRSYPGQAFADAALPPEAVEQLKTSVLDQLCQNPSEPDLPLYQPPFSGGQCVGKIYNVSGTYKIAGNPANQPFSAPGLEGQIGGVVVRPVDGVTPTAYAVHVVYGSGSVLGTRYFPVSGQDSSPSTFSAPAITNITTTDPAGDNCGDPPPTFPPPTGTPTASDYGNTFVLPPIPNLPAAPVFVQIKPTVNLPAVNFRPEINVQVGGINVNFSPGGVSFSASISPSVNVSIPSFPPGVPVPEPAAIAPFDSCEVDLSGIEETLEDIKDCACGEPYDVGVTGYASADSRTIPLPFDTLYVKLLITEISTSPRVEFGNDAPDVYYAGWAWFNIDGYNAERLPIDAVNKTFIPPKNATGFSYTCRRGYQAGLSVAYKQ